MSHPAPFARGLLVTTLLAASFLAASAHGQYPTSQPTIQPGQNGYGASWSRTDAYSRYPATSQGVLQTSGYSAPRYYVAQALEDTTPIDVPQASPSDMPLPPGAAVGPSQPVPPPSAANGYVNGHGGSYMGAACEPNGAYMNYNPSCNCLDGGYSTWGMWSNYSPASPCSGAGCHTGWEGHFGLFGRCSSCGGHCGTGCAAGCATGCTTGCASCQETCCVAPCRVWFGGIYALFMDRDLENAAWTSYDSSNLANQVLSSRDASSDWQPGNEVRFGSTFLCHCWAWEFAYWTLYDETDEAIVTSASLGAPVRSVLDFSGLDYDPGTGVSGVNSFFDDNGTGGVEAHRVRRHFELQNFEINMIYFPLMNSVGPFGVSRAGGGYFANTGYRGFSVVGIAGVRYMRIDDGFQFATSPTDFVFGNTPDDMFYQVEMENHLAGLQFGAGANYQATQVFSLYADGKFGIFANYIEHDSRIFGSNGFAVVTGGLPFAGQEFNIQSHKTDVSFLGEFRIGMALAVRPHIRLYGGWRAVGITGYAHPTEQIPQNFAGINDVVNIDSNGSLIVHGLEAGVEVAY
jgi:hypothetical protein